MTQDRRLRILGLVVLLVFGVAWARAAQLTTVQASDLRSKLVDGRKPETIAAPRGTITDANGYVLALSEGASDVSVTPYMLKDPATVAAKLAPLVNVPEDVLVKRISGTGGFAWAGRLVPAAQVKKIRALEIPGISFAPRTRRTYPQETVASQLLGTAGTDGQGLSGLEYSLDGVLRGEDGKRLLIRGRGGKDAKVVYVKDEKPTAPGKSVKLTIDARIQNRAEEILAETAQQFAPKSATAIVMRPSTGAVLAMANWPKVDANHPEDAPESAKMLQATGFVYEPGSTLKPFTVAGALEERKITPDSSFILAPQIQVADQTIKESHPRGTVNMTVGDILAQSSNVGTITIAQKLGATKFDSWIRKFGFGKHTGIELSEQRGVQLAVDDYSGSSIGTLPIGQGESVTPLQLASGYATIANNGIRHQPTVIDEINGERQRSPDATRVISAQTAKELRAMLTRTTEAGGTAASVAIKGYDIAGKTGTANKVIPGQAGYSKTAFVSSLFGMAPAEQPRVVVAIVVDQPSRNAYYGAEVAGPAFKNLTRWTLNYLGVPPDSPTG